MEPRDIVLPPPLQGYGLQGARGEHHGAKLNSLDKGNIVINSARGNVHNV